MRLECYDCITYWRVWLTLEKKSRFLGYDNKQNPEVRPKFLSPGESGILPSQLSSSVIVLVRILSVWKLSIVDGNTGNHTVVYKEIIIVKKRNGVFKIYVKIMYKLGIVPGNHLIQYKLFVLEMNTWNHITEWVGYWPLTESSSRDFSQQRYDQSGSLTARRDSVYNRECQWVTGYLWWGGGLQWPTVTSNWVPLVKENVRPRI